MFILHNRRKTDQILAELARAERRIGVLHAVAILKPPALAGDCEAVVRLADELASDAAR